ncbi:putative dephospho-CoA kinase [Natrialba magadii ATCC 43099]|uniref:Adenylate kinase n=1 Tax=Natrialba magadii (strain ATCC 43099 / DSM 3394 / CCM 3739 / CIP 104546 / IAM 13178 / JCM 8861 / NBRC 102185 / NCIMB 2190 / MS3) TaxID=547559 RepID=D3SUW5_NATMM|nr:AAA family ATPase [Natrialba magadii]ADD05373.1 putative dephospho-CoA kinase [Natrialba magadii ATCC 43099]ELY29311.1 adenylate kinase [Natrialba magadii ATCC 43099]
MHVIGTVGLPGSGKGEAATVAREDGIPVVTMGDVVRQETADRGLDPTKDHGTVAQALREENGPAAIAERSLPMIEDRLADHETVLVDGIRSDVEVDVFEERFSEAFTLVSIEAPFDVRAERIDARGRDASEANGGEGLAARDERERGFGMDDAMEHADVVVENTESLESFHEQIQSIIRDGATAESVDTDESESESESERETTASESESEAEPEEPQP